MYPHNKQRCRNILLCLATVIITSSITLWHHSGNKRNTKLAVVTAFDNRYMSEGVRQLKYFVGLKQMSNIQKSLIVYNLGINKTNFEIIQQKFSTKVRMRKMNFGRYPSFIGKVMTYGWKPLIMSECLEEFDVVWYLDAAVVVKGNFDNDLQDQIQIVQSTTTNMALYVKTGHSIFAATHPRMYDYLPLETACAKRTQMYGSNMILVTKTKHSQSIIKQWVKCALESQCLAPNGSQLHCIFDSSDIFKKYSNCHRFDQLAINILLARNSDCDVNQYRFHYPKVEIVVEEE